MEKTPTELKKKYKRWSRVCFFSEFLSVATPFVAIGLINYDKYFIQYNGTKMSIAFFLALAVMGLAVWLVAKKKFENSFITLLIGWATITGIFYLMGEMISDIATIMLFGLIGLAGAYGLDLGSKALDKKAKFVDEAIQQAKKEDLTEAYKEEVKVKVKIKK